MTAWLQRVDDSQRVAHVEARSYKVSARSAVWTGQIMLQWTPYNLGDDLSTIAEEDWEDILGTKLTGDGSQWFDAAAGLVRVKPIGPDAAGDQYTRNNATEVILHLAAPVVQAL